MKRFFQIFLVIVSIILISGLVIWVTIRSGRPLWVGLYMVSGIVGILIIAWLIRKIWLRRREKKFVNDILIEEDAGSSGEDEAYVNDIKDRWKTAMKDLKGSHLKNIGNPLYVLPWYMIIGESGTGKTSAIKNSHLSANFAEPNRISGFSGTKNCDWWFFEKAIILDTAGRYAIPENEERDNDEWQTFLGHLSKYRKKEPINGLIVTVSANKLLTADKSVIEDDGKKIRNRIEELMRFLGAKCPVHVLITKCDLVHGMSSFCNYLPENSYSQAFGHMNSGYTNDSGKFLEESFSKIIDRLKELRLLLSYKPGQEKISPEILLFPEEFEKLKPGLKMFFESAFQQNVFQETSLIRGIYFTSALQKGVPFSHFIDVMGVNGEKTESPEAEKSLFIHDFFSKILPGDRYLFEPTQRALDWKKKTRKIGGFGWMALVLALCGLIGFSFAKNLSIIRNAGFLLENNFTVTGELLRDISTIEDLRASIIDIQDQNKTWVLPKFGMKQSLEVEDKLKVKYCSIFKNEYLKPFDKILTDRLIAINDKTSDEEISYTVPSLVRRINLIDARLITPDLEVLKTKLQPDNRYFLEIEGKRVIPKVVRMYELQYLYYLIWEKDANLTAEVKTLREQLEFFAGKNNISMKWLVYWCNLNSGKNDLTLPYFWGGSGVDKSDTRIMPAFTVEGKDRIEGFLGEFETAMQQPLDIAKKKMEYDDWYRITYLNSWYNFGKKFPEGKKLLLTRDEKLSAAMKMAADDGPYFALKQKMRDELIPFSEDEEDPSYRWKSLIYEYDDIMKEAELLREEEEGSAGGGNSSAVTKRISRKVAGKTKVGRAGMKAARMTGANKMKIGSKGKGDEKRSLDLFMAAAEAYNDYRAALVEMASASVSPQASYGFTSVAFNEDPAMGQSAIFTSTKSIDLLKASLDSFRSSEEMIQKLISGPNDYLWSFLCEQTGCYIQSRWESSVMSETEGVHDTKQLNLLLWGEEGYVTKFKADVAKPFVSRSSKKGFYSKKVAGGNIKFDSKYFNFVRSRDFTKKTIKSSYRVKVKGVPTESNPNALIFPHMTRLELECGGGNQFMENYNYSIQRTFTWMPDSCGDVLLWVYVGDLKLLKKYTGDKPFANFLKDFSKGQVTYYRDDFPEYSSELKRIGIEYIKVKYVFSGSGPVVKLLNSSSRRTPKVIVKCSE